MKIFQKLNRVTHRQGTTSPVQPDDSQSYASWMIAFLVLLLAIMIIGMSSMNNVLTQWHHQLTSKMRIEIPQPKTVVIAQTMDLLQQTSGVAHAQLRNNNPEAIFDTTSPAIIDVDLKPSVPFDINAFTQQLEQIGVQNRIETYGQWKIKIGQLAFFLETLGYVLVLLIGLAVFVTISLVTRSGLVIHGDIINTLQLMGATPFYIAHQFEIQAFRLSLRGGVLGLIASVPFLYLLSIISRFWKLPELSFLFPSVSGLVIILMIPISVAFLSRIIARLAALRTLTTLN